MTREELEQSIARRKALLAQYVKPGDRIAATIDLLEQLKSNPEVALQFHLIQEEEAELDELNGFTRVTKANVGQIKCQACGGPIEIGGSAPLCFECLPLIFDSEEEQRVLNSQFYTNLSKPTSSS